MVMKSRIKIVLAGLFFVLVSCAVITVNIYFPEKDVKEAYKSLEKELMGPDTKKDEKKPEGKPQSSLDFEIITPAYAQESGLADKLSEMMKKMPDVVNAYKEMGARIADIDRLRDGGTVGEGKDGLLVIREGTLSSGDKKLVEQENQNRNTVMNGMAKAMLRTNREKENEATLKKVMPQAVDYFASLRRDSAKKGWWMQDASGNWVKK
jgi:uncharacterized protein YdbL (DUF1318 family)